jgi:hypothetical protein
VAPAVAGIATTLDEAGSLDVVEEEHQLLASRCSDSPSVCWGIGP